MFEYVFHSFCYFYYKEAEQPGSRPQEPCQEESEDERVYIQDCSFENTTYRVGDFVYVEPSESKLQPHIVSIERLWEDKAGTSLISSFGTVMCTML